MISYAAVFFFGYLPKATETVEGYRKYITPLTEETESVGEGVAVSMIVRFAYITVVS